MKSNIRALVFLAASATSAASAVSARLPFALPSCANGPDSNPDTGPVTTAAAWASAVAPLQTAGASAEDLLTISEVVTLTVVETVTRDASVTDRPEVATKTVNQPAATHAVTVGTSGASRFSPNTVNASVGDTVRFELTAVNITLIQSSLSTPCLASGDADAAFRPLNRSSPSSPSYINYQVASPDPQWFSYKQPNQTRCGKGLVFAINPGGQFDLFLSNACSQSSSAGNSTWHKSPRFLKTSKNYGRL